MGNKAGISKSDFKLNRGKVIKADNFKWVHLPDGLKASIVSLFRVLK